MDLILVGIGGIFGGILRFAAGKAISQKTDTQFPIGTFIINISGALLLGVLTAIDPGNNMFLLFGDGFLGAFTTFSTLMYEGFNLFAGGEKKNALVYILGSAVLGVIGYIAGFAAVKLFR